MSEELLKPLFLYDPSLIAAAAKAKAVARLVALSAVMYAEQGTASGRDFDNVFNFGWHYDYYLELVNRKYDEVDEDGIKLSGEWLDEWFEATEAACKYVEKNAKAREADNT